MTESAQHVGLHMDPDGTFLGEGAGEAMRIYELTDLIQISIGGLRPGNLGDLEDLSALQEQQLKLENRFSL